jgi:hypothetical protein
MNPVTVKIPVNLTEPMLENRAYELCVEPGRTHGHAVAG